MSETSTSRMPSRRQRRDVMRYQGILGIINKLSYVKRAEIRQSNLAKGREIHAANVDAADKAKYGVLEDRQIKMTETWKGIGYNDEEIEMLKEAWSITAVGGATREDKKEKRELLKKAKASMLQRRAA